jgi:hypothetical protein
MRCEKIFGSVLGKVTDSHLTVLVNDREIGGWPFGGSLLPGTAR